MKNSEKSEFKVLFSSEALIKFLSQNEVIKNLKRENEYLKQSMFVMVVLFLLKVCVNVLIAAYK